MNISALIDDSKIQAVVLKTRNSIVILNQFSCVSEVEKESQEVSRWL